MNVFLFSGVVSSKPNLGYEVFNPQLVMSL